MANALDNGPLQPRLVNFDGSELADTTRTAVPSEQNESEQTESEPPQQPFYHLTQEKMAGRIFDRIEVILHHYHRGRTLDYFDKFEFQVYTFNNNMVEQQTINRLCHPEAECFPASFSQRQVQSEAGKRVNKYNLSAVVESRHAELVRRAEREPKTLFLIIADESHWGIESGRYDRKAANKKLVDSWDHGKHPNVIVLHVSATPYNLLTTCSSMVQDKFYARHMYRKDKEPIMLSIRDGRCLTADGLQTDVTDYDMPRNLHHIKWSETFEDKLKMGIVVKLKIAVGREGFAWMCVGNAANRQGRFRLEGTEDPKMAHELLLRGNIRKVRITTPDGTLMLGILDSGGTHTLSFMDEQSKGRCAQPFHKDFTLHCQFGQDVFELEGVQDLANTYLQYDPQKHEVVLGKRPTKERCPYFEINPSRYTFQIDSLRPVQQIKPGKEYLSLNYLFNTMRKSGKERLLRTDYHFTKMCRKIQYADSSILAAEYSYYILLAKCVQDTKLQKCTTQSDNDDETRQIIEDYCKHLHDIFQDFLTKLLKYKKDKTIQPQVFKEVCGYLREEAITSFQIQLLETDFSKLNVHVHQEVNDLSSNFDNLDLGDRGLADEERAKQRRLDITNLRAALIQLIVHGLAPTEIDQLLQESHMAWTGILQSDDSPSIVEHLQEQSETFSIVNDLLSGRTDATLPTGLNGNMKILRLSSSGPAESKNQIYATLCMAQVCAEVEKKFLILRDYGGFKLMHDLELDLPKDITYSDLDKLPCILILDMKGQMGFTFPPSFNAMDLRLKYTTGSSLVLTTIVQSLGRLCRYTEKDGSKVLPYALVGSSLENALKETLEKSSVFVGIVTHKSCKVDIHAKVDKKANQLVSPIKMGTHDHNKEQHNRLLLEAEPQVGKTGVFLKVISLLSKHFDRSGSDGDVDQEFIESGDDDDDDGEQSVQNLVQNRDASDWKYPSWEHMTGGQVKPLRTQFDSGKYSNVYGPYEYGKAPEVLALMKEGCRNHRTPAVLTEDAGEDCRAYSLKSHRCQQCMYETTSSVSLIDVGGNKVNISVPGSERFTPLINMIDPHQTQGTGVSKTKDFNCRKLDTWIFMPSYRRVMDANINLAHTMVDDDGNTVDYIQVLVVRAEEYETYCQQWQSTHAVLCLPDTLSLQDGTTADVSQGGIGYARLFIQLFAEKLDLKRIFVLDDNIPRLYKVVEKKGVIVRTNRNVELENISLFKVLCDLESCLNHQEETPKDMFESFSQYKDQEEYCSLRTKGLQSCRLHSFTGPPSRYAIIGIMKRRPTTKRVVNPFKKTHVHSLVLLNIEVLKKAGIRYKPWPVFEDCTINNDCDAKGLWVCKYCKFIMAKTDLKTWSPLVYEWLPGISLASMNNDAEEVTEWVAPLVKWLKDNAPPKRLDVLGDKPNRHTPNLVWEVRKIGSDEGTCLVLVIQGQFSEDLFMVLQMHFFRNPGIGGFGQHAVFLPTSLCLERKLLKLEDFNRDLVSPCFRQPHFKVITSHNIQKFRVPMLLLYIEGEAKFKHDGRTDGNLGEVSASPLQSPGKWMQTKKPDVDLSVSLSTPQTSGEQTESETPDISANVSTLQIPNKEVQQTMLNVSVITSTSQSQVLGEQLQSETAHAWVWGDTDWKMQDLQHHVHHIVNKDTDMVIIHLGTCNVFSNESDAQCCENCQSALDEVERSTGRTPLMLCAVPYTHMPDRQRRVQMVNEVIKYKCMTSYKMAYVDTGLKPSDIGRDGITLTNDGIRKVIGAIWKVIQNFK